MILIISNPESSTKEQFSNTIQPLEEQYLSVYIRTLKLGGEIWPELEGEPWQHDIFVSSVQLMMQSETTGNSR